MGLWLVIVVDWVSRRPYWGFLRDTLYVLWRVFTHVFAWFADMGFERKELYILRGDQCTLVVWNTNEPPPIMPVRLKPWKIILPGWSAFTRLPHIREDEVRYSWL
ncbi:MAG: hypothetical protein EOP83_15275 [Verrucomicrobiaceae bacterium]|nr:MAG: hypothetical protein EOP83_15275 [Verrucomicrobiaceae bacterium]